MYQIVEFFEPIDVTTWLLRVFLLYTISCFTIWIVAFILSRLKWSNEGGIIMRVYFGWLIPLTLHCIISTFFLLISAKFYKELGISLWFCAAYLIPIFLSGGVGIDLSTKIKERIRDKQINRERQ
jgi:hypothetical protein